MADSPVPDPAALAREAAFAGILQWGDPVLRSQASAVRAFDGDLAARVERMIAIMDRADGAGLAAPQVGDLSRFFIYRVSRGQPARALVNPVIERFSDDTVTGLEGCLSLGRAGVHVAVERALGVTVRAQELDGSEVVFDAEGMHARILQHETDHLDGILMLQRTTAEQRRDATRALRDGLRWAPAVDPADVAETIDE
ncbi:MAG: peptide deformylase [Solirubrobacteraceae bacterium]|nr:peptide deformylase [Patulibacter sp.]